MGNRAQEREIKYKAKRDKFKKFILDNLKDNLILDEDGYYDLNREFKEACEELSENLALVTIFGKKFDLYENMGLKCAEMIENKTDEEIQKTIDSIIFPYLIEEDEDFDGFDNDYLFQEENERKCQT